MRPPRSQPIGVRLLGRAVPKAISDYQVTCGGCGTDDSGAESGPLHRLTGWRFFISALAAYSGGAHQDAGQEILNCASAFLSVSAPVEQ